MRTMMLKSSLLALALAASGVAIAQTQQEVSSDSPAANKTVTSNDTTAPEWTSADTNRDGFLSKEELIPYPGLAEKFEMIDTNGDGKISQGEYADYRAGKTPEHTQDHMH